MYFSTHISSFRMNVLHELCSGFLTLGSITLDALLKKSSHPLKSSSSRGKNALLPFLIESKWQGEQSLSK